MMNLMAILIKTESEIKKAQNWATSRIDEIENAYQARHRVALEHYMNYNSKTFKKWVVLTNSISEPDMALAYPELKKKYGRKFNDRMLNWMKGSGVPLEDIKTFITNKERDYAVWITIRSTRSVVAEWKKIRQLAIERVFQYFPVAVIVNGQTAILVYFQSFEE